VLWEDYLKEQAEERQRILEQKQNAPVNKDVQFLVETFIKDGIEEMILQLNKIVKKKKLKTIEVIMLSDKLKNVLVNKCLFLNQKQYRGC
jgi:hypothetical protein